MRIRVETPGVSDRSFHVAPGERVLHAGLAQGLALPYECGTGTCGQCRAVLDSGLVRDLWPEAPGNEFRRADRNEILMCQSCPETDCVLKVPPAPAATVSGLPAPNYFNGRVTSTPVLSQDVLRLRVELERPLKSLPGQFVLLDNASIQGSRAYSLTTPERTTQIDLLIRRKAEGRFTEWLFSPQCVGEPVNVFGPIGRAVFRLETDKDLLLAAGGTGVASTLAILRAASRVGHFENHRADVFFGVRTHEDMFCVDELCAFSQAAPSGAININVCFSHSAALPNARPGVRFRSGFVHEIVKQDIGTITPARTTALLAGPPPMIDALLPLLIKSKIPARQIRYDKFS